MSFGLQLMLQTEQDTRKKNRIARLLKDAVFPYPASFEELDYDTARGVDATTVAQLGTCEFVRNGQTIVINGATGTGKTYLPRRWRAGLFNNSCNSSLTVSLIQLLHHRK
jgi:DNA replication protein DnaC